jgi:hypothetical protein
MKNPNSYSSSCNGSASFLDLITANRKKVFVLVAIAAVLVGMEALGYLRDVERPSSVEWLFKPKAR